MREYLQAKAPPGSLPPPFLFNGSGPCTPPPSLLLRARWFPSFPATRARALKRSAFSNPSGTARISGVMQKGNAVVRIAVPPLATHIPPYKLVRLGAKKLG